MGPRRRGQLCRRVSRSGRRRRRHLHRHVARARGEDARRGPARQRQPGRFHGAGQRHAPHRRPEHHPALRLRLHHRQVLRHRVGDPLHQAIRQGRRRLRVHPELLERPDHRQHRGRRSATGLHRFPHRGCALGAGPRQPRAARPGRDHGHTVFRIGEYTGSISGRARRPWPPSWTTSTPPTPPTTSPASAGQSSARTAWATPSPP